MRIPCFPYTLVVAALSFAAPSLSAQDNAAVCEGLINTVEGLSTSPDVSQPFILKSLASEAMRAHEACAATSRRRFTVYALYQAVFALDHLSRYAEADALVDVYAERYADHPSYQDAGRDPFFRAYRARFAAWRVRFATRGGDYITAALTIGEATTFTDVLPLASQIDLRLALASLYEQDAWYSQALVIIERIEAEHGARLQADAALRTTYARVLVAGGKLLGKQGRSDATSPLTPEQIGLLEEAERRLTQSVGWYERAGERGRRAEAVVLLGEVRSTLRNTPAYLSSALDSARVWGAERSVVYGLWRRGQHYLRAGDPREAERDFTEARALSDSVGLGAFDRGLALDLGRAYEAQGRLDQARAAFEAAHRWSEGRLGARWRELAQRHLRKIDRRESRRTLRWYGAGVALLLVLLAASGLIVVRQRWELQRICTTEPLNTHPTEETPTNDAFTRCYRRAYEALAEPDEVAAIIDDPVLSGYLTEGGIKQKGELYDVTSDLVRVLDGKDVDSAAVRTALIRGFKKRGWAWPKSVDELRRHVQNHPPEEV